MSRAVSSPGLIVSITSCISPLREEMQAWLEATAEEAVRLAGTSVSRVLVEADLPDYSRPDTGVASWLTCVDVDMSSMDRVFDELLAAEREGEQARRMMGLATRRELRSYRPLAVSPVARAEDASRVGEVLHAVWWTPDDGAEQELSDWYDGDHIPTLMTVPGWLRIRRYELVRGGGPRFLALHDIANAEVPQSGHPSLAAASRTDWRQRVLLQRRQYEFSRYVTTSQ